MVNWIIDNLMWIGVAIIAIAAVIVNWLRTKQLKKTAEIYEEVIKEGENDNPQFYYDSAITYMEIGQRKKAINWMKEFISLFPENPAIKDATEVLAKMKRKFSPLLREVWIYHYLGEIYRRKGNIEKAKGLFKEQLKRDPNANAALYGLGIIYAREGNVEEGIKYLERFLQLPGARWRTDFQKREMNAKIALKELREKGIYTSSEDRGEKAEKFMLIIFSFLLIGGLIFFLGFVIYELFIR